VTSGDPLLVVAGDDKLRARRLADGVSTGMRVLIGLAASLAFSLATLALLQGFAQLSAGSVQALMRDWEADGRIAEWGEWNVAVERLELSRRLNPLDADHSADLGRLMEWRSWRHGPYSSAFDTNRDLANRFYLEAINKRPSWGFAWAHYADNRFIQGRTGSEYQEALGHAIRFSPWEPGTQRKVAWMGIASWKYLRPELREQVRKNIERSVELDVHRYEIIRIAIQYDWMEQLESMLRSESQLATLKRVRQQMDRH